MSITGFGPIATTPPWGDRSVVAGLSDRVDVSFISTRVRRIDDAHCRDFLTSESGTLGAADLTPIDGGELPGGHRLSSPSDF